MRVAKADDYWRGVYKRPYNLSLSELTFTEVLGIGSGSVTFRGGITAICGGNGVGKTTLLETVFASLSLDNSDSLRYKVLFNNTELKARLNMDSSVVERVSLYQGNTISITPENMEYIKLTWLDAASLSRILKVLFSEMANLDELLEPLQPRYADDEELKTLSYLTSKVYESCEIYEIEDYNDQPTFPYFRVVSDGMVYGSETMGLGEMALYLILWHLRNINANSILLLEEPETYISHKSQMALLNLLAYYSIKKDLWIILTTHSPGIVGRIPPEHVRVLYRIAGKVTVIDSPTRQQLHDILGIRTQCDSILLVEDYAASLFAQFWINYCNPSYYNNLDIVVAHSSGDISAALCKFPRTRPWLKIIGLFDGDMRSSFQNLTPKEKENYKWPYIFLPGNTAPEELLIEVAKRSANEIAPLVYRTPDEVNFIIAELTGVDHHDWIVGLSNKLGISYELMIKIMFDIWINLEANKQLSSSAFNELTALLESFPKVQ